MVLLLMGKRIKLLLLAASAALLLFLTGIKPVEACGGLFCEPNRPVVQAGEAIVFGVTSSDDNSTTTVRMDVQILYEGPAEKFSWLLPLPFPPKLSIGSEVLFDRLFQVTLPQFTLQIDEDQSTTCDSEPPLSTCSPTASSVGGGGVEVLEQGSVGPFSFVVLEATKTSALRQWLLDNGYDEYEGSAELLNYYVLLNHKFVALKLLKDKDVGEIQPIVLTYDMPMGIPQDPTLLAIACVPIKLTAVAANDDMPIQVYILGDSRAVPLNFFEVELDDRQADWLRCQFSSSCSINDLRQRFAAAVSTSGVDQHAFMTEYAGNASIMANEVQIDIDLETLKGLTSPEAFLDALATADVPSIPLVDFIIEKYIPAVYEDDAPFFCDTLGSTYSPPISWCAEFLVTQTFDSVALAAELQEKVFDPSVEAQAYVDSYSYLTRLYAEMSPGTMDKDPFFSFDPDLPDVSHIHTAVGVPECAANGDRLALDIYVGNDDRVSPARIPARVVCGSYIRRDSDPLFGPDDSPALRFTAAAFGTEPRVSLERDANGTFTEKDVTELVTRLDGRVVNQTVPEFVEGPPTPTPSTLAPVSSAPPSAAPSMTPLAPTTSVPTTTPTPAPQVTAHPSAAPGVPSMTWFDCPFLFAVGVLLLLLMDA